MLKNEIEINSIAHSISVRSHFMLVVLCSMLFFCSVVCAISDVSYSSYHMVTYSDPFF